MVTTEQLHGWQGRTALDTSGEEVGTVKSTYEDKETGKPDWLTVSSGLLGRNVRFVPAIGAAEEGDAVKLGWDKDTIEESPDVKDSGGLTPDEEQSLRDHYDIKVADFGYEEDDGSAKGGMQDDQSDEQADQQAKDDEQQGMDDRRDARQAAKNLRRPEDTATEHDGSQVRPDK